MDAVDDTSNRLGASTAPIVEDRPSLLCIVLDTHAEIWHELGNNSLRNALEAVLVFINAHLALNNANQIAVYGYNSCGADIFYQGPHTRHNNKISQQIKVQGTMYGLFHDIDEAIVNALGAQLTRKPKKGQGSVSGPLALALCYCDRMAREIQDLQSRIMVLSVSSDTPKHYMATMDCIFAAQKMGVPIDVCSLYGRKTFLQQAAEFTNGVYLNVTNPQRLAHYLLTAFCVDPSLRPRVNLATEQDVDFRAVCYQTKTVVDIGWVCSVCLCILKDLPEKCPVCNSPLHADSNGNPK